MHIFRLNPLKIRNPYKAHARSKELLMRRTRMSLQLAHGSLEHPLGLLEDVKVKSCGIEYLQTFAIVNFGKKTNYEVILG